MQAQAVTARSYAYIHLSSEPSRMYDVTGGVLDQVYGGVEAETPVASEAVESTRTLVLKYRGPRRQRAVPLDVRRIDGGGVGDLAVERRAVSAARERPDSRHGPLLLRPLAALSLDAYARRLDVECRARAVSGDVHVGAGPNARRRRAT